MAVIIFIVILAALVLVHEMGHFFTALWMKMKVEEFGIGFPPRAKKLFTRKGIDYTLNWLPLGGFVKIKGESGEDAEDEDSFAHKKVWQRFVVLIAGVTMNMIFAYFLYSVGYGIGLPQVIDNSTVGNVSNKNLLVLQVQEGSPAQNAGLVVGDQIKSLDGYDFSSINDFQKYVADNKDKEIQVTVRHEGESKIYKIKPTIENNKAVFGVGLVESGIVSYSWPQAFVQGAKATYFTTANILVAFGGMLKNLFTTGKVGADVSGPVGIAVMTGQVAKLGWIYILQFAALLSINLAIINVLPIPALDGGRILFLFIEKIIRRPVKQEVEAFIHNTGFVLLMILIVVVTVRDIGKFSDPIINFFKNLF